MMLRCRRFHYRPLYQFDSGVYWYKSLSSGEVFERCPFLDEHNLKLFDTHNAPFAKSELIERFIRGQHDGEHHAPPDGEHYALAEGEYAQQEGEFVQQEAEPMAEGEGEYQHPDGEGEPEYQAEEGLAQEGLAEGEPLAEEHEGEGELVYQAVGEQYVHQDGEGEGEGVYQPESEAVVASSRARRALSKRAALNDNGKLLGEAYDAWMADFDEGGSGVLSDANDSVYKCSYDTKSEVGLARLPHKSLSCLPHVHVSHIRSLHGRPVSHEPFSRLPLSRQPLPSHQVVSLDTGETSSQSSTEAEFLDDGKDLAMIWMDGRPLYVDESLDPGPKPSVANVKLAAVYSKLKKHYNHFLSEYPASYSCVVPAPLASNETMPDEASMEHAHVTEQRRLARMVNVAAPHYCRYFDYHSWCEAEPYWLNVLCRKGTFYEKFKRQRQRCYDAIVDPLDTQLEKWMGLLRLAASELGKKHTSEHELLQDMVVAREASVVPLLAPLHMLKHDMPTYFAAKITSTRFAATVLPLGRQGREGGKRIGEDAETAEEAELREEDDVHQDESTARCDCVGPRHFLLYDPHRNVYLDKYSDLKAFREEHNADPLRRPLARVLRGSKHIETQALNVLRGKANQYSSIVENILAGTAQERKVPEVFALDPAESLRHGTAEGGTAGGATLPERMEAPPYYAAQTSEELVRIIKKSEPLDEWPDCPLEDAEIASYELYFSKPFPTADDYANAVPTPYFAELKVMLDDCLKMYDKLMHAVDAARAMGVTNLTELVHKLDDMSAAVDDDDFGALVELGKDVASLRLEKDKMKPEEDQIYSYLKKRQNPSLSPSPRPHLSPRPCPHPRPRPHPRTRPHPLGTCASMCHWTMRPWTMRRKTSECNATCTTASH